MDEKLGTIIKRLREQRGLSLKDLARDAGISLSEIYRIEDGQRCPRAQTLRKMAKPLGASEIDLFKLAGFLSMDESEVKLFRLAGLIE